MRSLSIFMSQLDVVRSIRHYSQFWPEHNLCSGAKRERSRAAIFFSSDGLIQRLRKFLLLALTTRAARAVTWRRGCGL